MELNEINSGNWGSEVDKVNNNFQKTGTELEKLWNKTDGLSSGQVTLGKVSSLKELYTPNTSTGDRVSPQKGDRWIVLDQKNPENDLPYYFVYKGNEVEQIGNISTNWSNTGETIIGSDVVTKSDINTKADKVNEKGESVFYGEVDIPDNIVIANEGLNVINPTQLGGHTSVKIPSDNGSYKDILPTTTLTRGYYLDKDAGNVVTFADYGYTDYIDVSKTPDLKIYLVSNNGGVFYNENKEYLSGFGYSPTKYDVVQAVPSSAKYARINIYLPDITTGKAYLYIWDSESSNSYYKIDWLVVDKSQILDSFNTHIDYIAIGDSITLGQNATKPFASLLADTLSGTYNNYAVGGTSCMGNSGLIAQVKKIPNEFEGLVTLMIGANDFARKPLGDPQLVLKKDYASLSVDSNFSEAFRLCLETILRNSPKSKVMVILPIKMADVDEVLYETFRQAQRVICEYFAVPYSNLYLKCRICNLTYPLFMPDKVHPNNEGHKEIFNILYPEIMDILSLTS